MSKKDDFKEFASKNPSLAKYIENGEMSWQKFYELYDIYGEDVNIKIVKEMQKVVLK